MLVYDKNIVNHPVSHSASDILGKLAKVVQLVLLDHLSVIRELLEYLGFLSLPAATHFLYALLPLLKMNMTLKDTFIITLRKMLFSE